MPEQPTFPHRALVSRKIVDHEVDFQLVRHIGVNGVQEASELLRTMPAVRLGDDLAGGRIKGGKEPDGAVAAAIVRSALKLRSRTASRAHEKTLSASWSGVGLPIAAGPSPPGPRSTGVSTGRKHFHCLRRLPRFAPEHSTDNYYRPSACNADSQPSCRGFPRRGEGLLRRVPDCRLVQTPSDY
jgi:hypothetical protein